MKKRLAEHKAGKQVANERGISYRIVRWWKGGRALERELKNKKCSPKLCPICSVVKGKNQ